MSKSDVDVCYVFISSQTPFKSLLKKKKVPLPPRRRPKVAGT